MKLIGQVIFNLKSYFNWTSSVTNMTYTIIWYLSIDNVNHYFIPHNLNGEIYFKNLPIFLWDSSVTVYDSKGNIEGIGFSEIYN